MWGVWQGEGKSGGREGRCVELLGCMGRGVRSVGVWKSVEGREMWGVWESVREVWGR